MTFLQIAFAAGNIPLENFPEMTVMKLKFHPEAANYPRGHSAAFSANTAEAIGESNFFSFALLVFRDPISALS